MSVNGHKGAPRFTEAAIAMLHGETKTYPACKGANCGCTDGKSHSAECLAEHEAAIGAGESTVYPLGLVVDNPNAHIQHKDAVPCPKCRAAAGEFCTEDDGALLVGYHVERVKLAEKLPIAMFDKSLDATDKSIIICYAYIMLCDSVSASAQTMFGKEISARDVQVFFAEKAIIEARQDGLLK